MGKRKKNMFNYFVEQCGVNTSRNMPNSKFVIHNEKITTRNFFQHLTQSKRQMQNSETD